MVAERSSPRKVPRLIRRTASSGRWSRRLPLAARSRSRRAHRRRESHPRDRAGPALTASTWACGAGLPRQRLHVHLPTWALAHRQIRLSTPASLDDALIGWQRGPEPAQPAAGCAPGLALWRLVAADRADQHAPRPGHRRHARALMSRDYTRCAQFPGPRPAKRATCGRGGVVERDEARAEPTGVLREDAPWHFRDTYVRATEESWSTRRASRFRIGNRRSSPPFTTRGCSAARRRSASGQAHSTSGAAVIPANR